MQATPESEGEPRPTHGLIVRTFLESALGLLGLFLLAAVVAPMLFDIRNNFAVIAGVLVWIACPVLLLLLVWRVAGRWRRS